MSRIELRISKLEDLEFVPYDLSILHFEFCINDLIELRKKDPSISLEVQTKALFSFINERYWWCGPLSLHTQKLLMNWMMEHLDTLSTLDTFADESAGFRSTGTEVILKLLHLVPPDQAESIWWNRLRTTTDLNEIDVLFNVFHKIRVTQTRTNREIPHEEKLRVALVANEYLNHNFHPDFYLRTEMDQIRDYENYYLLRYERERKDGNQEPGSHSLIGAGIPYLLVSKITNSMNYLQWSDPELSMFQFDLECRRKKGYWEVEFPKTLLTETTLQEFLENPLELGQFNIQGDPYTYQFEIASSTYTLRKLLDHGMKWEFRFVEKPNH